MGLQCSILGHAFEPGGVERDREEQGSEVVTTEREIQRCSRCGTERVVSESTEVTAVVDANDVDLESEAERIAEADVDETEGESESVLGGIVERSDTVEEPAADQTDDSPEPDAGSSEKSGVDPVDLDEEPPNPAEEDAEILTDDDVESEREPGQWPDDPGVESAADAATGVADDAGDAADNSGDTDDDPGDASELSEPEEYSLSGITVPEGEIVCPECSFSVEASSGYRDGDPCPECNAWLEAERNQ